MFTIEIPSEIPTAAPKTETMATRKQIDFIYALAAQRKMEVSTANLTKAGASKMISEIKAMPTLDRPEDVPEGMHKIDGIFFKVQRAVHGSGRVYAKALVEDGEGGWRFEYTPGAIYRLSEHTRITLEEAQQFGALYGTCVVCGRLLTNEDSIARGIGPVCAQRV